MARPREFEREEVVQKALAVFWRQGYQATSVQDLVAVTGLNRGSLYDTFGDKHGLFLAVVEHYRTTITAQRLARLEQPGPAREKIATFFKDMIEFSVGEGRLLGCLMTNSAIELAPHDRDTHPCDNQIGAADDALTPGAAHRLSFEPFWCVQSSAGLLWN